ncbi:hypothetical protein ACH40F_12360 [Streptomyces sp. NPDC020794]|uniref:hypothetical protein n=1 Tax=unclassified Streptomyces TaxID=2593676 RepID=UPI0036E71E01
MHDEKMSYVHVHSDDERQKFENSMFGGRKPGSSVPIDICGLRAIRHACVLVWTQSANLSTFRAEMLSGAQGLD